MITQSSSRFPDNGGRRSGLDRRQFTYSGHIPERRVLEDRRHVLDRRSGLDRRQGKTVSVKVVEMRSGLERRKGWGGAP